MKVSDFKVCLFSGHCLVNSSYLSSCQGSVWRQASLDQWDTRWDILELSGKENQLFLSCSVWTGKLWPQSLLMANSWSREQSASVVWIAESTLSKEPGSYMVLFSHWMNQFWSLISLWTFCYIRNIYNRKQFYLALVSKMQEHCILYFSFTRPIII